MQRRLERVNSLSVQDAAYIAGLIDADGTITASARHLHMPIEDRVTPHPLIGVFNSNYPIIEWLKETIGAGTSYLAKSHPVRPDQNEAVWNKVHRFQITGFKAVSLLDEILPYLRIKHQHALLVSSLPLRIRDFGRKASVEQKVKAFETLDEIRRLNKRGLIPDYIK